MKPILNKKGQAVTEYILLIAVVTGFYFLVNKALNRMGLGQKLTQMMLGQFKAVYQYGHPKAKGPDDPGGPINHPRFDGGEGNFRIFINPKVN